MLKMKYRNRINELANKINDETPMKILRQRKIELIQYPKAVIGNRTLQPCINDTAERERTKSPYLKHITDTA